MISNNLRNKIKNVVQERSGQSLIEVIVGLAIGAILMGASAFVVAGMLQANTTSQKWRSANALAQGLLTNVRAYGTVNWQNLYGLSKSSSTTYFLNASGTVFNVVQGQEGVLDNDVTNGLVGEWKFDEDVNTTSTTTNDASGNGNYGVLTNSPTRASSTCKLGNCLSFYSTSTQYVNVSNSSSLNFGNGDFSIVLWLNTPASGDAQGVIYKGASSFNTGGLGWDARVRIAGGPRIEFCVWNGVGTCPRLTINPIPTNTWFQLAITHVRATGNTIGYVNGIANASANQTTGSYTDNYPLYIGAGENNALTGSIDDARIYNRALSADEVKQLYNSNLFTRYFYVENTCRTMDASSSITGVAPCAGGSSDDPSTQKVSSMMQWTTPAGVNLSLILADYVTRWKNSVFQQNDWSGGPNAGNAVTSPTNLFTSSTGINFSGKSIRIQGL